MEKGHFKMIIGVLAILFSCFVLKKWSNNDDNSFLESNLEALAQGEAVIICNSGICGRCFEEKTAWPYYKCNWTGMQEDFCDCDKVGWL